MALRTIKAALIDADKVLVELKKQFNTVYESTVLVGDKFYRVFTVDSPKPVVVTIGTINVELSDSTPEEAIMRGVYVSDRDMGTAVSVGTVASGLGTQTVTVRAVDADGVTSDAISVSVKVADTGTPVAYTISYVLGGGILSTTHHSYDTNDEDITLDTPTKDYYTFSGWYDNSTFTGDAVTEIATGSTGNKIFYAKFTPIEYAITYTLDDGTNGENPETYNIEDETITLENATKTGYTFDGWYSEAGFENAVTEITSGSHGAVTLYAKFTITDYDITYVLDEGTNDPANPATYTITTATITLADATKANYTFDGWFTEATFENAITEIVLGSTGDITVYAKWTSAE